MKAVSVKKKLTPEIEKILETAFRTAPTGKLDMPKGKIHKSRRFKNLGYEC